MRISIVGTGYVGLVTGVCFAEQGHDVVCVDVDPAKVERINRGEPIIHEEGLEPLLLQHIGKSFRATTDCRTAVLTSDATFIAVGTPFDGQRIDLQFVRAAAEEVGQALRDKAAFHVVVVKSTVVPGTTEEVVGPLLAAASGKEIGSEIGLGTNPEFLSEGTAIADFLHPDRLVFGASDKRTLDLIEALYEKFAGVPRVRTNNKTAEMIKYASNSLLAALISFSNEFGNLCSTLGGVDSQDVMQGVHLSQYLSPRLPNGERFTAPIAAFLQAGCGFGGSCLPKDVNALIQHAEKAGQPMPLLKAVMQINDEQPRRTLSLLKKHFPTLRDVRVSVLGLAFKPDTDDVRLSPAMPIINQLLAEQAQVAAYDPVAGDAARQALGDAPIRYCTTLQDAVDEADAVIIATGWQEFQQLPQLLNGRARELVVVDGRRTLDRSQVTRYEGVGA